MLRSLVLKKHFQVSEHPSSTRMGGRPAKKLFERSEFFLDSLFVSFLVMKKESPRQGRKKGSPALLLFYSIFNIPAGGFLLAWPKRNKNPRRRKLAPLKQYAAMPPAETSTALI